MYRKKMGVSSEYNRYAHPSRSPRYFPKSDTVENENYFTSAYNEPNIESPATENYMTNRTSSRRRVYNRYTQAQRKEMAEYSTKYGVNAAVQYFSAVLGTDVPAATIAYIRSKYNKWKRETFGEKRSVPPYHEHDGSAGEERNEKPMVKFSPRSFNSMEPLGRLYSGTGQNEHDNGPSSSYKPSENWMYDSDDDSYFDPTLYSDGDESESC